jgi:hypothetical protein
MPFISYSIFYKRGADGKQFEAIGKVYSQLTRKDLPEGNNVYILQPNNTT